MAERRARGLRERGRAAQDGGWGAGKDSRCEYGGRRAGHRSLPRHRGVAARRCRPPNAASKEENTRDTAAERWLPRILYFRCKLCRLRVHTGFRVKSDLRCRRSPGLNLSASENSCRGQREITSRERRAALRRSFRDSNKLRHGGHRMRPHRGVHHAAVPGRRRVTARAPDRGCVSRARNEASRLGRPLGTLRGARVTRAANPRRPRRFQRGSGARGSPRSTDRPPPIPPPPQIFARSRTRPKAPRSDTA